VDGLRPLPLPFPDCGGHCPALAVAPGAPGGGWYGPRWTPTLGLKVMRGGPPRGDATEGGGEEASLPTPARRGLRIGITPRPDETTDIGPFGLSFDGGGILGPKWGEDWTATLPPEDRGCCRLFWALDAPPPANPLLIMGGIDGMRWLFIGGMLGMLLRAVEDSCGEEEGGCDASRDGGADEFKAKGGLGGWDGAVLALIPLPAPPVMGCGGAAGGVGVGMGMGMGVGAGVGVGVGVAASFTTGCDTDGAATTAWSLSESSSSESRSMLCIVFDILEIFCGADQNIIPT